MSECQDLEPLFTPYVDGEAPPHDRASVDAHLHRCPPCHDRIEMERTARDILTARREHMRSPASDRLRACCERRRGALSAPRSMFAGRRTWVPLSLAATLLLAVAGVFVLGLNNKVEALAAQLVLDHVKCFALSGDHSGTVNPIAAANDWQREQGWAVQVPASSAAIGLELCGVRRCFTTGGRMAHLLYKWRGHPLSVFIIPQALGRPAAREIVEKFGREAVIWTDGGRTYVVLAQARPAELDPVVMYVKDHAR
ncbi:MAG: hypothetical protein A3H96_15880 [Acidobacteria bacterium RIFCSPLOWO2_02_FULL_67_36]|nr:MAG: hypothetical protein A3H96_15880 [Acidobacteria bacterium RIFCSPLOWO2_02_FULL_67_36]OFW24154.1 MAG: hypothetical protein A3G21_20580 [Acidobacteria bacterium RIFCSPLOWO2_12_FULL_66_21]